MKDFLRQQLEAAQDNLRRRSIVREYLQARVLQALQDAGAFLNWAFLGGTALRFLYGLPRYSEDLDFSLEDRAVDCEFEKILGSARRDLEAETYELGIKVAGKGAVKSALLKFPGLLMELGCSPHASEVLTIKCEVATNPPAGAKTETTIVRRFVTVNVKHYDKSSLLAGKLHAILARPYTKGRDLYDLVWYLAGRSWPEPNIPLLNSALEQTGWDEPAITGDNWREVVVTRIEKVDWDRARADLMPFLERQADLPLISCENCKGLLLGKCLVHGEVRPWRLKTVMGFANRKRALAFERYLKSPLRPRAFARKRR